MFIRIMGALMAKMMSPVYEYHECRLRRCRRRRPMYVYRLSAAAKEFGSFPLHCLLFRQRALILRRFYSVSTRQKAPHTECVSV